MTATHRPPCGAAEYPLDMAAGFPQTEQCNRMGTEEATGFL